MFKSASIFRIAFNQPDPFSGGSSSIESALKDTAYIGTFTPCGASQERSSGWVPPRGLEFGERVENVGGQMIMALAIETKSVPANVVREAVAVKVKQIEDTTGRKPGKKERRDLAEDTKLALLPMAFANKSITMLWIDKTTGMLVVDSASQARTDEVVTQLVRLMDGIVIRPVSTNKSESTYMTTRLALDQLADDETAPVFDIGRACTLKACDESKAVVRYQRHSLDTDEVRQHIKQGKMATKLALAYNDRVAFVLDEAGTLSGISFLDVVFENQQESKADAFDADVTIMTAELGPLISDLIDELGGEVVE